MGTSLRRTEPPHREPRHTTRPLRRTAVALAGAALVATLTACAGGAATAPEPRTPQPASTAGLTKADVDAWLDDTLPDALAEAKVAGATVSVVHDGEMLTARGFGVADVAAGTPVDPDGTLFRLGSLSKMFTATAVMQLVEDGQVDLDTDVEQYTQLGLDLDHPVTLRHLLTHTSGFEERLSGMFGAPGQAPDLRASLVIDPPEQVFEPGTTPAYSNYGNALAGYVVEAVSGQRFEEYVAEHVLAPAGMSSSTFEQPLPEDLAGQMSQGYATSDDPPSDFEVVGQPPAGALSATATDMARFMLVHLGRQADGDDVLSDATRRLMQEPALDADSLGALAAGPRMGLGWFDETGRGPRAVGHGGDTNVFHTHLRLWPDEGTGLFVSFNSTGPGQSAYALRDEVLAAFTDRYLPADGPTTSEVDDATRAAHAEVVAGSYRSNRGFHSTFMSAVSLVRPLQLQVVDGDRVLLPPGVTSVHPLLYEEIEPWVYQEVGGDRRFVVETDDEGRVELIGHDSAMTLVPVSATGSAAVPALLGGVVVLLLGLLAWSAGAVVRKVRGRTVRDSAGPGTSPASPSSTSPSPASPSRARLRLPRALTRVASASAVLAVAGWAFVAMSIMQLEGDFPTSVIRVVQVLTWIGVLGLLAAVWRLVAESRAGTGPLRVAGAGVLLVAFAAVSWSANELLLTSPNITY
ncbi:MAG: beta-lactamase family protein [Cellulomonas sp.]|uniref:serine hydrolase domain-containing protein n=1 Tax=Cellulomonas sp. TaxID=40001 RepID=UPI001A0E771F|nr:serine hydrolase domain-containing protein [Cellulomonas sp.]MBF0687384.1 beta-lactamase family protein [Cellulomonas sp.]